MAILNNTGIRAGASGAGGDAYQIEKSLRFNSADTAYFNRDHVAGNSNTYTISWWQKYTKTITNQRIFGTGTGAYQHSVMFDGLNRFYLYYNSSSGSGSFTSEERFGDPTAWYHFVFAVDTTQETSTDRMKLWVNGVQLTDVVSTTYPNKDVDMKWNHATTHYIGRYASGYYWDGYMAEVFMIDGTAHDASTFGEEDNNGKWIPKDCSEDLTYGTNGCYLKFDNTSDLGEDSSGNDNDFTANNFSTTAGAGNDSLTDSPTTFDDEGNGTGNYATLNSLHKGTNATLSNGNLQLVNTTTWGTTISTIGMSSGKWYAEVTLSGTIGYTAFGVSSIDGAYVTSYLGIDADSYAWFAYSGGGLYTAGDYTDQTGDWVVDCAADDVIGLALDMDNGTLKYYKNDTLLGGDNAFTGITGTQFFATCGYSQTENWNFGQRAFDNLPTGYKALNTYNLDDTTILSGEYEGNADADGPFVWMNATPATLRISSTNDPPVEGDAVTFDPADVDPLAGGFKIRNSSTNNGSGTTYYWLATTNRAFKYANAQSNE